LITDRSVTGRELRENRRIGAKILMTESAGWLLAALLLVGLISLVVIFQGRFIYFPLRYSPAQLEEARTLGVEEIGFRTSQGNQAAYFWQSKDSNRAPQNIWLLFGGNGDVALAWLSLLRAFPKPLNGFLLIDYPGYGKCQGRVNPQTILENSERALQTLLEKKAWKSGAQTLCILGHSLGGAAALNFAAKYPVRKVLVISTFTTMDDMVRAQIHVPLGSLLRHRFDNVASLKAILAKSQVPEIYVFHGQADEIIPLKMGRALAQLDPRRIKYTEIPGTGHNDIVQMPLPLSLQSALFGSDLPR
jgi:pimeloyl-ACP methyl ester carboxylesterase